MSASEIYKLRSMLLKDDDTFVWTETDIMLIKSNETFLKSFLETNRDIDSAAAGIKKCLSWRRKNQIGDLKATHFAKEVHQIGYVYKLQSDRNGTPVMLVRLCAPSPPKSLYPLAIRYFSWHIDQFFSIVLETGRKPGFVFDCSNVGIDITLIKEVLNILVFIYPPWVEYLTFCNLNWSFTAIYKIITKFLPSNIREILSSADHEFLENLTKRKEDLPYYLGGDLWTVSSDDFLNSPNFDKCDETKKLNCKQLDEAYKYYKKNIPIMGNGWWIDIIDNPNYRFY